MIHWSDLNQLNLSELKWTGSKINERNTPHFPNTHNWILTIWYKLVLYPGHWYIKSWDTLLPDSYGIVLLYVWSSVRDSVICLYHKILENFVQLILKDGFWVLHIPFVCIVKLKFLVQFPVDHLVVSSLVFFLC